MKKSILFALMVMLFASVAAAPAQAGTWYLGGGFESISLGDDLDVVDNSTGFTFSFGYRASPQFELDFLWGASVHDVQAGGEAGYGRFLMGGKLIFLDPGSVQPYLTGGLASHAISFDFFDDITGSGLYIGAGIDVYLDPSNRVSLGVRNGKWEGEDSGFTYDVDTGMFTIVFNHLFMN